jgi:hypothetical protein
MVNRMSSGGTHDRTRAEWRQLGFYYEQGNAEWRLVGSRAGLRRFADALRELAFDDRAWERPTHRHLGPYEYFTLTAWTELTVDERGVAGGAQELDTLACIVEAALEECGPGERLSLRDEVAGPWSLSLDVREDGFDPASTDPLLAQAPGT